MGIIDVGDNTFIDTEPVEAPSGPSDALIYAYAHFRSLEHIAYGLIRTTGGPKDEEIGREEVGGYGMEPLAPFWEFGDALRELEREHHGFEDVPLVEVASEEEYDEALDACNVEDSEWEGPGLYDFRDEPPSFEGSVEDYEQEEMERATKEAFDFMFQGDEWEDAFYDLSRELPGE